MRKAAGGEDHPLTRANPERFSIRRRLDADDSIAVVNQLHHPMSGQNMRPLGGKPRFARVDYASAVADAAGQGVSMFIVGNERTPAGDLVLVQMIGVIRRCVAADREESET